MSNTDKRTLIKLVKQEAKNIKENATAREIKRLKIESIDPANVEQCIYGQMTGDCYSKRATNLIIKCATEVYKPITKSTNPLNSVELAIDKDLLVGQWRKYGVERDCLFHSPIEVFIYQHCYENGNIDREGNIKSLINYLKGVTKTLSLK